MPTRRATVTGLAVVLAAHALAATILLSARSVPPIPERVLGVTLLPARAVEASPTPTPAAPVAPARPRPRPVEPAAAAPRLVVPEQVATAPAEVPPVPLPAPVPAAAPNPVPSPTPAQTDSPPATTLTPAPAVTPARFDADYLDNPKPAYPAISRRLGEEGRVLLRVRVDAEGRASDAQIHASSGFDRLDRAALATVLRWKFVPARRGADAVAATVLVPITFSLKG